MTALPVKYPQEYAAIPLQKPLTMPKAASQKMIDRTPPESALVCPELKAQQRGTGAGGKLWPSLTRSGFQVSKGAIQLWP